MFSMAGPLIVELPGGRVKWGMAGSPVRDEATVWLFERSLMTNPSETFCSVAPDPLAITAETFAGFVSQSDRRAGAGETTVTVRDICWAPPGTGVTSRSAVPASVQN